MVDAAYQKKFYEDEFFDDINSFAFLVDAGDYDGDGKSEILFWFERYNRDGYVLFYDKCSKFDEFTWPYH